MLTCAKTWHRPQRILLLSCARLTWKLRFPAGVQYLWSRPISSASQLFSGGSYRPLTCDPISFPMQPRTPAAPPCHLGCSLALSQIAPKSELGQHHHCVYLQDRPKFILSV